MEYVNLGDVATYINGYAFKPEHRGKKGLPIIRIQDLNGNSHDLAFFDGKYPEQVEINTGDILISWSGSLGVYKWNKGKALLNQHIFKVLFNKIEIDKEYFCYAIRNSLSSMSQQTHGATMKHITKKDFDNISIPYPDLIEQKKIANNLNIVNKLIMFYEKELILFEQMVKARFIEMFGDININNKNWHTEHLGKLCNIVRGSSPRPIEKYLGGDIPWIKIGDATDGDNIYLNSTKEHIIREGVNKSRFVKKGSLIFANCGVSLGFARIISFDGCIHDGWLALENIDSRLNKEFLLLSLNQLTDHFRIIAPSGTQPNLNIAIMQNFMQVIPPMELQETFVSFRRQVDKSREEVKKSLEKTQQLYDSLMQEYFG